MASDWQAKSSSRDRDKWVLSRGRRSLSFETTAPPLDLAEPCEQLRQQNFGWANVGLCVDLHDAVQDEEILEQLHQEIRRLVVQLDLGKRQPIARRGEGDVQLLGHPGPPALGRNDPGTRLVREPLLTDEVADLLAATYELPLEQAVEGLGRPWPHAPGRYEVGLRDDARPHHSTQDGDFARRQRVLRAASGNRIDLLAHLLNPRSLCVRFRSCNQLHHSALPSRPHSLLVRFLQRLMGGLPRRWLGLLQAGHRLPQRSDQRLLFVLEAPRLPLPALRPVLEQSLLELGVLHGGEIHQDAVGVLHGRFAPQLTLEDLDAGVLRQLDHLLDVVLGDVLADHLTFGPAQLAQPSPANRQGIEGLADLDQVVCLAESEIGRFDDLLKQLRLTVLQLTQLTPKIEEIVLDVLGHRQRLLVDLFGGLRHFPPPWGYLTSWTTT